MSMRSWARLGIVCLAALAAVSGAGGQALRAARLFGSAEAVLRSVAAALDPVDRVDYADNLAAARAQLDDETWDKLWAEGLDMTFDQAIAYAQTASDSDKPPTPLPGDLTRREREVARLIAEGKSNREIADVLVIAERTVEGHVSNILSKLGFRSRSQISVWVVENGLSDR